MAQQSLTLKSLRQSIGYNLQDMVLVTASTTGDTSSLIATYSLQRGGDDEYNGRQVYAATPAGSIVAGEKSWVSDFDGTAKDATLAPVMSAIVANGDVFELWKVFTVEEINDAINQAINDVTAKTLQIKELHTPFTEDDKYLYDVLSGFTHLSTVEYVYSIDVDHLLEDCEDAWTGGTSVVASVDSSFKKKGTYSAKFVVAAGAATGATLCYEDISEVDISDSDEVELWMYSTIALTAGQLQFMLGATAAIASPLETINIPAMDAGTWYRHVLSLADPSSDTAIISIGVRQASGVDVGAFTFYQDDIRAVASNSRVYKPLPIEYWDIAQAATPLLMLTQSGLTLVGTNTQMRLTGYQIPSRMTADTDTSEVDPAYLIAKTTGHLLTSHAKSPFLDINDRAKLGQYWLAKAAQMETGITPSLPGTTRSIQ